jgi:hypothetical protein
VYVLCACVSIFLWMKSLYVAVVCSEYFPETFLRSICIFCFVTRVGLKIAHKHLLKAVDLCSIFYFDIIDDEIFQLNSTQHIFIGQTEISTITDLIFLSYGEGYGKSI